MSLVAFLILTFVALVGTVSTYYLSCYANQGPVRSSALLALIVGGFFYFFSDILPSFYVTKIPLYMIGGTFIGMVTTKNHVNFLTLIIAPILFSILMLGSERVLKGYGGALGTMACIALMSAMVLSLFNKKKAS